MSYLPNLAGLYQTVWAWIKGDFLAPWSFAPKIMDEINIKNLLRQPCHVKLFPRRICSLYVKRYYTVSQEIWRCWAPSLKSLTHMLVALVKRCDKHTKDGFKTFLGHRISVRYVAVEWEEFFLAPYGFTSVGLGPKKTCPSQMYFHTKFGRSK